MGADPRPGQQVQAAGAALYGPVGRAVADPVLVHSALAIGNDLSGGALRTHLGVETQRQWSDLAILRTTPALLGLFSLVTLLAHQQVPSEKLSVRQAAWYVKVQPTFSDALASVRRELWGHALFCMCSVKTDVEKLPQAFMERFAETLCYAN